MQESLLLKIALITSVVGLALLMLLLRITGFKEIDISEANQIEEGTAVKITGTVERVTSKEGFSIIRIKKEETMDVVLFDSINLSQGQRIEVTGKTKEYQGTKELVADRIVVK
jgi:DNA/RNA endonuclease YhcR with UshA esterase domain